jgi:hypothetical protein
LGTADFHERYANRKEGGGSRPLFTGAVVAAIVIVVGLLTWRLFLT